MKTESKLMLVRSWKEGRLGSDYLMAMNFPSEMMKMLQNMTDLMVSHVNALNATESLLKLLVLCYVNCKIKKK